jgi:CRP-like cAMP-binding protein
VTPEDEAARLLAQLRDAGTRRASANRHRFDGLQQLNQAYQDIRVYAAEAGPLGITRAQVAEAVGVTRQQLYIILTRTTDL